MHCTRWDSNSGPLVYETSDLPIELKGIPSSRVSIKRLVPTHTCDIFSRTFASLTRNIFATQRNTESMFERPCHKCKYNCEKLYCTRRDSNSGPSVYEISALPIECYKTSLKKVRVHQRQNNFDSLEHFSSSKSSMYRYIGENQVSKGPFPESNSYFTRAT